MELLHDIDELRPGLRFALAIGSFDGVHRGHLHVLQRTVDVAHRLDATPVVLTFEPHPAAVLHGTAPPRLSDPAERLSLIARAGVATTVVQRFDDDFAAQSAEAFLRRLAAGRDLAGVVMTPESAFGRDRSGTTDEVQRLSSVLGFHLAEAEQLVLGGAPVSSSRIRQLLRQGRLAQARCLLGRDYAVVGEVVAGDARGRDLGYPTANLRPADEVVLPPDGIYAARVSWGGTDPLDPSERRDGVASLGVRPTFGDSGARILEVFLLDFDGDLYGERLRLEFVRRQRGERRFSSVAALIEQMDRDAERARRILRLTDRGRLGRRTERMC